MGRLRLKNENSLSKAAAKRPSSTVLHKTGDTPAKATACPPPSVAKTTAERAHAEKTAERRRGELAKAISKPHKERVAQLNQYLERLSQHYDIPKVGPG